jgi:hypothetical protein
MTWTFIPQIQGIVGSNIKVSNQSHDSLAITFEGKNLLVFGFQAVQLFILLTAI